MNLLAPTKCNLILDFYFDDFYSNKNKFWEFHKFEFVVLKWKIFHEENDCNNELGL